MDRFVSRGDRGDDAAFVGEDDDLDSISKVELGKDAGDVLAPAGCRVWCNHRMDIAELVEDLMAYIPLPPSGSRHWSAEACFNFQPGRIQAFANVSALRATIGTLADVSRSAADYFATRGRDDFVWFIGPRSTPDGTVAALTSLGARVLGDCAAMMLDHEPPRMDEVEVRPVASPEQLLTYRRIGIAAEAGADPTPEQLAELTSTNDVAWGDYASYAGRRRNFLAYLAGEPVSAAGLLLTEHGVAVMSGGATLPWARGRGLYRALVHARWSVARQMNAGPLAVQASTMSSPVLARAGFVRLADMTIVVQSTVA